MKIQLPALFFFLLTCIFFSCAKKQHFQVSGNVSEAKDQILFLERVGYDQVTLLDSSRLNESGWFHFQQKRPLAPDFYRLRLDRSVIYFAIDSVEHVIIQASGNDFARDYTIKGSEPSEKIKEFALLQLLTAEVCNQALKEIPVNETAIMQAVAHYKEVTKNFIFQNPTSTAAYFALFQQVNNQLLYNPYDKEDNKVFRAVATSWDLYYPQVERTIHLSKLTIQALKIIRGNRPINYQEQDAKKYLDFSLSNIHGKMISLSQVTQDQVVLLDFTAYAAKNAPAHNILLHSIYKKYHHHGFEILQVSLDADEHLWKNAASNLPWLCVRDPQTVYSHITEKYNVSQIPTGFLFNREGDLEQRIDAFELLESEVKKLMK